MSFAKNAAILALAAYGTYTIVNKDCVRKRIQRGVKNYLNEDK